MCLSTQFYGKISAHIRKSLIHDSTSAIALIMLYNNRKSLIFKVLDFVVYTLIEKYLCVDYLCLQIEVKLLLLHRIFEDKSIYEISIVGIIEVLLHIVSCYSYNKDDNSTLILTCMIKLVSYYPWKVFVIIENSSQSLNNMTQTFQNRINDIIMYDSYSIMSCCTPTPSVANTLTNIYLGEPLRDEFTSE